MERLYEGKAKIIYKTEERDKYIVYFKDSATAFDAQKVSEFIGKGALNNAVSSLLFELLQSKGIKTHYIKKLSDNEMLVKRAQRIDVEVVVRNVASGSICKRLGIEEGIKFKNPIIEFFYKNDLLKDPLICYEHILLLDLMKEEEILHVKSTAFEVNQILRDFFMEHGLILVDFKLEFGRFDDGSIGIIDEISPDTCRLWDASTGEKLDKDRFRFDLGDLLEGYKKVLAKIKGEKL